MADCTTQTLKSYVEGLADGDNNQGGVTVYGIQNGSEVKILLPSPVSGVVDPGQLSNGGQTLTIAEINNRTVFLFHYGDGWITPDQYTVTGNAIDFSDGTDGLVIEAGKPYAFFLI